MGENNSGEKSIVRSSKLTYEYIRRDEEGNVESIVTALDGVDIELSRGDFICILGSNGSGKSTFAKHINALLTPTDGTMWVDGKDTKSIEELWEIRRRTGMVFQNPDNQIISSVVEEDVGFGPENLGIPTEEIWERVNEALDSVNMISYRKHSPNRLSGGQKQRVAIAGIVAMQPKCIVLDEPTAMLDPGGRIDVINTCLMLNREKGVTIILITHYMDEAIQADKVFVMDKGRVVLKGTPREVFREVEKLQSYKLDVPYAALLSYRLRKAGLDLPPDILTREELTKELCRLLLTT